MNIIDSLKKYIIEQSNPCPTVLIKDTPYAIKDVECYRTCFIWNLKENLHRQRCKLNKSKPRERKKILRTVELLEADIEAVSEFKFEGEK